MKICGETSGMLKLKFIEEVFGRFERKMNETQTNVQESMKAHWLRGKDEHHFQERML